MNIRALAAIFAGLLLTGCSADDLNNAISYTGLSDKPDKAAPPPRTPRRPSRAMSIATHRQRQPRLKGRS